MAQNSSEAEISLGEVSVYTSPEEAVNRPKKAVNQDRVDALADGASPIPHEEIQRFYESELAIAFGEVKGPNFI